MLPCITFVLRKKIHLLKAKPCLCTWQSSCHCCCWMRKSLGEILSVSCFDTEWWVVSHTCCSCHTTVRLIGGIQRWLQAGQGCQPVSEQSWRVFQMLIGKSGPSSPSSAEREHFPIYKDSVGEDGWFSCGFFSCFSNSRDSNIEVMGVPGEQKWGNYHKTGVCTA